MVRRKSEDGVVAIIVSISMVSLLVITAMVLDFGLVRLDRQVNKSSADAAAAAGVRGLDRGTGDVYPFAGACQALSFLRANSAALNSLPAWSSCAAGSPAYNIKCKATDSATHASYTEDVGRYRVHIESPASLSTGNFQEETLTSLTSDPADPDEGNCDQLSVTITQTRPAGLGSLATSSDLASRVRSVGRVQIGDEGDGSVALLVLERNNCPAISAGGAGGKITVEGNGDVPGLIHTDSLGNGTGCGGGTKVITASSGNDVTAKQAETGAPRLAGVIAMVALSATPGAVPANAFIGPVVAEGGTPTARNLVTRSPIDGRYREAVKSAITAANTATNNWASSAPAGWTPAGCTLDSTQRNVPGPLWIDCPNFSGNATINASEVMFTGSVKPGGDAFSLPNATKVYVGAGIDLTNSRTFAMNQGTNATCPAGLRTSRGKLFLKSNGVSETGGTLRLCNTSVVMMSGSTSGCVPISDGTAPTSTPCGGAGTGILSSTGGAVDWTAPNAKDLLADQTDWNDLEDLALWTEAGGLHGLGGGASMHVGGVFMLPNADLRLRGNGTQDMRNSQYIVRTLDVQGASTEMIMKPDPHNSVKVPIIMGFEMVR